MVNAVSSVLSEVAMSFLDDDDHPGHEVLDFIHQELDFGDREFDEDVESGFFDPDEDEDFDDDDDDDDDFFDDDDYDDDDFFDDDDFDDDDY